MNKKYLGQKERTISYGKSKKMIYYTLSILIITFILMYQKSTVDAKTKLPMDCTVNSKIHKLLTHEVIPLSTNEDTLIYIINGEYNTVSYSNLKQQFLQYDSNLNLKLLEIESNKLKYQLSVTESGEIQKKITAIVNQNSKYISLRQQYMEYKEQLLSTDTITEDKKSNVQTLEEQINNIDISIEENKALLDSYYSSLRSSDLQGKLYQYYLKNSDIIETEMKQKALSSFIKQLYDLVLLDESLQYSKLIYEGYELEKQIADVKYKKGLLSDDEYDITQINIDNQSVTVTDYTEQLHNQKDSIEVNLGQTLDYTYQIEFDIKDRVYTEQDFINRVKANSSDWRVLQYQINVYQDYCKGISNYTNEYIEANLTLKTLINTSNKLDKTIRSYVKKVMRDYQTNIKYMTVYKKKLATCTKNYEYMKKKYEKGLATKLDLANVLIENQEVKMKYYEFIYQVSIGNYIMQNGFYE